MQRIIGHHEVIDTIERALSSQRVHHCWVFSGPRGVGKFTAAVEFARLLLDPGAGPDLSGRWSSAPENRVSQLIDAETHPDLHVVRKELALISDNSQLRKKKLSNIPVDVLRERMIGGKMSDGRVVDASAYRTAQMGHGKVFIIDEAELLDNVGQNALLKTLEEPPRQTYIILVTDRAERLLPTILSRSARVSFGSLSQPEMVQWIDRSGLTLEPNERDWILQFSNGAPGVAEFAVTYGFFGWWQTLAPMLDEIWRGGFPALLGATLAEQVEAFATAWVKGHDNASKDAANKAGAGHVLSILAHAARTRVLANAAGGPALDQGLAAIDAIGDAERSLRSNVNMKMVLEDLTAQMAMPAPCA